VHISPLVFSTFHPEIAYLYGLIKFQTFILLCTFASLFIHACLTFACLTFLKSHFKARFIYRLIFSFGTNIRQTLVHCLVSFRADNKRLSCRTYLQQRSKTEFVTVVVVGVYSLSLHLLTITSQRQQVIRNLAIPNALVLITNR
jgi:hypothetical protein